MNDKNISNNKDSMFINKQPSLNNDISSESIELSQDDTNSKFNVNDDSTLFEEPPADGERSQGDTKKTARNYNKEIYLNNNFNDNFINKTSANLNDPQKSENFEGNNKLNAASAENSSDNVQQITDSISEKEYTIAQKNYNDSLDFLDDNVKYSKYVIYIDPQNVDFIDSLTVKERKNLINKILREQDDIATVNHRLKFIKTVIKHVIAAILTISISVPVIYWVINTSLEATISNYRHSQKIFQTLYKENGKITNIR